MSHAHAQTVPAFTAALAGLDRAVRHGEDPTEALRALDTILSGRPPSAAVLGQLLDATSGLAATWARAATTMADQAQAAAEVPDAQRVDVAAHLQGVTERRVAEAADAGDLQGAVDALFLGGALLHRAGGDPERLLSLLGPLEILYGHDQVEAALDAAWGGRLRPGRHAPGPS